MPKRTRSLVDSPLCEAAEKLTPATRSLMLRLVSVLKANNAVLPEQMLTEIEAISLEGVSPQWQIDEMQKILDRWMPKH